MTYWTVVIPLVTAVIGLFVGHLLTTRREAARRRREIRINYLIDAYRKLERGSAPTSDLYNAGEFESAIADIQLLGNVDQVALAHKFCEAANSGDGSLLQELLEDTRLELRNELQLCGEGLPSIRPFRIETANKSLKRTR